MGGSAPFGEVVSNDGTPSHFGSYETGPSFAAPTEATGLASIGNATGITGSFTPSP